METIEFFYRNIDFIIALTIEHIALVAVAVGLATVIGYQLVSLLRRIDVSRIPCFTSHQ